MGPVVTPGAMLVRRVGSLVAVLLVGGAVTTQAATAIRYAETAAYDLPSTLRRLTLDSPHGDAVIGVARSDTPRARVATRWSGREPEVSVAPAPGGAEASMSASCSAWSSWGRCQVDWDLLVPPDTAVGVDISVGDVRLADLRGPVLVTTTTGSITLERVGGPAATLRSTTGDVDVRGGGTRELAIRTTTGDVVVAPGPSVTRVAAMTTTGDVTVLLPRDGSPYRVEGESRTGTRSIEVTDDPQAARVIRVDTTTGDVTVRYDDARS
jgi:hypothetical protein